MPISPEFSSDSGNRFRVPDSRPVSCHKQPSVVSLLLRAIRPSIKWPSDAFVLSVGFGKLDADFGDLPDFLVDVCFALPLTCLKLSLVTLDFGKAFDCFDSD